MDSWNAEQGRGREKRNQKKEEVDARKDRKVAIHCVFPMICGSGGSKSRLARAAGAEPAGQMRHEKVHAVVARSTFPSQNGQNTRGADHFWKLRCRKSARRCGAKHILKSKCTKHTMVGPLLEVAMSKKCTPLWREAHFEVKNTPWSDHFWKLRCRKSARRCGAKHISESKCTKHHMFAPLLEVRMLEKCTPLWREAHFQVKMHKTHHVRTTFGVWDVEFRKSARRCGAKQISKSECPKHTMFGPLLESEMSSFEKVRAVVARSTFPSQNVKNTRVSDHFWRFRCRFASLRVTSLHYTTWHYTTWHYTKPIMQPSADDGK